MVKAHLGYNLTSVLYVLLLMGYGLYVGGQFFVLMPFHRFWVNFTEILQANLVFLFGAFLGIFLAEPGFDVISILVLVLPFFSWSVLILLRRFKEYQEREVLVTSNTLYEIDLRKRVA
jgi:hypothetical protein